MVLHDVTSNVDSGERKERGTEREGMRDGGKESEWGRCQVKVKGTLEG